ncbi:putative N6-adenosine-methyltransferase MT-A70-like [Hibiscus syriacus]|uniref:N6-adenosine-methyltransferase MT-A70-like n=1 Tax=Hibiscus syriacus TaxID=106335 RepID=A0A6A2YXC2_HIBSY|nr:N6-adenosine-methyltransferase MT-A70-like [Hibiscus syriacus]KAE8683907.1 putative N6-adenosine-methyltransferase MT-A70-like [Hibiscus syriacus]
MESNTGGEDTVATIKSIRTQLETRIQQQRATQLDLLASLQSLDPNIVPTLDLSLRFVSAFNRRPFSPTSPLPTPKKISHPPQHPPGHSVPDPKQLALVKPVPGDKDVDESGNPLSLVRAMVAECLLQRVPFKPIDSSTVLRKLENDENITAADKAAMREVGGDSGAILAVGIALRSMAEDNGGLEIEEFDVGGKSRVMVLSIDQTRLVRELPEEPENHPKRERLNNDNESVNLKINSNSNNEWLAPRPMGEMWMGDPGMMYPPGGPMAGPRDRGMWMIGRPPMAPNSGLLPAQRQRTEEDDLKDLEALLNKKSFKEMQKSKTGEEILNIINRPTAKETAVAAKFKSKGGSQVREYCSSLTKEDCQRQSGTFLACKKVHFKRRIAPHTDISLGDCSFLDTCRHMKTCKYVHYELDQTHDYLGPEKLLKPPRAEYCSEVELGESQWISCDIRNFRMDILGQFGVIMADPPWDIHMELPYGTMADDEMRNLNVPALQTDGLIFLWVTGRAMELGRECLEQWGYKRCEEIIWVKTNQLQRIIRTGRTGHWLNHSKEHCLVGIKGNPEINKNIDTDVLVAEVRETSRKPDEMYPMLERISPRTRKLELFARMHNTHAGWISLGNQLNGVRLVDEGLRARYKAAYPHIEVQPPSPPKASAMEIDSTAARSPFATEARSQFADAAAPEERAMALDADMAG